MVSPLSKPETAGCAGNRGGSLFANLHQGESVIDLLNAIEAYCRVAGHGPLGALMMVALDMITCICRTWKRGSWCRFLEGCPGNNLIDIFRDRHYDRL